MSALTLGFIPLTDCAPLVVASALGLFREEGLEVTLSREASWATVRDKVAVGALHGAHMLAPMALAAGLEAGPSPPLIAPLALNRGGSGVTLSAALVRALREEGPLDARALARLIARRAAAGSPPLTFAVVFPWSIHNYLLRYWLAQAGIDPDRDVRLVVTPPPRMVEQLRGGAIDGFCVGAPWNAVAMAEGIGELVLHGSAFWAGAPDKVLGVAAGWAAEQPDALQALLRAVLRAGAWADDPANRPELIALLAQPGHVGAAPEAIAFALNGELVFQRGDAAFPWRSQAAWLLSQMQRWGQAGPDLDAAAVALAVYRPDLYRTAAAALDLAAPTVDSRPEGAGGFFDGKAFDPAQPLAYARSFAINRL
ncbi:NitT/TauT family transport system ATP-binding protein/nitrate/nitrite transport system substrate-binding protein [Caulobacter ginsengisoli]|uniref:NitT/TauT family transport system ATP-binding protein/nitrate/nitrite transport system substrate-binding protein n=1 Tax=Caulobacter ginsengisoli TaxID=400775 RepID=A0ABU0ILI2_9CAUL|nr:CmpA/NrtA family ABC transporter substrate-binding protein [Caulobacter ginsengisoli]MDQ0462880.1 NitT/TauT family transport system ATP-binding protein/nitrate/nitrite transport system substrate-binding protein [Caulobacter ginsengisoli]